MGTARRTDDRKTGSGRALQGLTHGRYGRLHVSQGDAVDVNVVGGNRRRRTETGLTSEGDFFVDVVTGDKGEWILRTEDERAGNAIAGDADATDVDAVFVKWDAARRTIERRAEHRHDGQPGSAAETDDAAGRAEFVDVGRKQIRKADTDEGAGGVLRTPGGKCC